MKILIIEDEQPALERLTRMIHNFNPAYEIIGSLESVQEGIDWFENNDNPDLVFLDIHLSDGNSFELLRSTGITCPVIFTTSHAQYVVNAFEAFAIDYLFKPIKRAAFTDAMNRFLQRRPSSDNRNPVMDQNNPRQKISGNPVEMKLSSRILVKIGHQLKLLELNEASYFIYEERMTLYIARDDKKYPLDFSLDYLEKVLDPQRFYRINRQSIVNFQSIEQIVTYSKSRLKIALNNKGKSEFDISADRTVDFKQWLVSCKTNS